MGKKEWLAEIANPISVPLEQVRKNLRKFVNAFPKNEIPHTSIGEEIFELQKKNILKSLIEGRKESDFEIDSNSDLQL
jgi:hypothetical protein